MYRMTLQPHCNITSHSFGALKHFATWGVQLTPLFQTLFQANYHPIISHIRSLLKDWDKYHVSFLGRVTAIKMAILPKLLFFFRTLPIYVSKTYIESIQRDVNKFIWRHK